MCLCLSGFASRDMLLPDPGMVHGRMLVTAWDYGLDTVDDTSVKVVMHALEVRHAHLNIHCFEC